MFIKTITFALLNYIFLLVRLERLRIDFFKNFETLDISFASKLNCFVGKNGVGKTNLLDAIFYSAMCKSNFAIQDAQCVKFSESFFSLQANFIKDNLAFPIICAYQIDSKRKQIKCNDKKYDRISDHIGLIPIIFITPSDISLVNGSGAERRRFLDMFISQMDKDYMHALLKYNKLILQRNKFLKQADSDNDLFSVWDEQLIYVSNIIFQKRQNVINKLLPFVQKYYSLIANTESVNIQYISSLNKCDIADLLKKNKSKDVLLQHTTDGVHRDDLNLLINNFQLKTAGSQGQKKSFLLALRFAQYEYLVNQLSVKPLLLLDDLFDKLDYERCFNIIKLVSSDIFGQIFISDTDKTYIGEMIKKMDNAQSRLFFINENSSISYI